MRLSITKNKAFILLFQLLVLWSCSKSTEENYVVKVGNSLLTESMIDEALKGEEKHKFRNEFIRKWIEKELLYLSAVDKGILESEEFITLEEQSKRDIANAVLIKEIFMKVNNSVSDKELENYFVENISEFKIPVTKFKYSIVSFKSKSIARKFRRSLVSVGWERSLEKFANDKSVVLVKENLFDPVYNISSKTIVAILQKMPVNSYSKYFQSHNGIYSVLWLKKVYRKDDVPEFVDIKEEVKNKYISSKRDIIYNEYLKNLYSQYKIEMYRKE